jgi:hypothetical protein
MNVELFVIVAALAVIAAVAVWLLKKWAAKPNEWESKIAPNMQTEEMKPAEMPPDAVRKPPPPILPPQKPLPKQEQPRRK